MKEIKLIQLVSIIAATLNFIVILGDGAPAAEVAKTTIVEATSNSQQQPVEIQRKLPATLSNKIKRDSQNQVEAAESSIVELDTQETGFGLPGHYNKADSDYGYDSGKNTYGKQASDWSLYDQG